MVLDFWWGISLGFIKRKQVKKIIANHPRKISASYFWGGWFYKMDDIMNKINFLIST